MASDNVHPPYKRRHDDAHGDAELSPPRERAEDRFGSSGHPTHAERVERVNAYLTWAASNGIWSRIE